ncbi:MAG: hypothetical protein COX57_08375 [Alphaproteobacteria bacterium CG_4_10_14_0_2_um_filter_63_37]|nr:MAG: hypothetical protein AUJ55_07560 [Proteobacteria bacterium CG1_02_64_396]PJA24466.1 MAG: hypothetical protein COX57_08375 [Alphaproteobacteria bacterium CG_4_10_14_0_2_um_filter_63_37]
MWDIVIVEDDQGVLIPLEILLSLKNGYQVSAIDNPDDGWHVLISEGARLLITDLMMEPFDGFEMIRRVRNAADPGLAKIPIVVLTAKGQDRDAAKALALGANLFLTKPFDPETLSRKVGELLLG